MKQILLTKGKFALVDDNEYERVSAFKWNYNGGYAKRNAYVPMIKGVRKGRTILMHRFIMNTPDGMHTDHKDGNPLNNQKSNLRICTVSENVRNKRGHSKISKFKGAYFNKRDQKWFSMIAVNKKLIQLGRFKSEEDAATAYNLAAFLHHGEFAKVNEGFNDWA